MKIYTIRASIASACMLASIALSSTAFAQAPTVVVGSVAAPMPVFCKWIDSNVRLGATDAQTGGSVTALQQYLSDQGYFNASYVGTGRFGPLTLSAVAHYQAAQGLPATGYVGPMTRGVILKHCGIIVPPKQTVSISYLSPQSAKVEASVIISGNGFISSNTILMDGMVIAHGVSPQPAMMRPCYANSYCDSEAKLAFTVPDFLSPYCAPNMMCPMYVRQVTPGTYKIQVQNDNGTSNSVELQVIGSGGTGTLSVTGLDAPSSMPIGQSGTWTVHASVPDTAGTLHYSVVWGDENMGMNAQIMAPQSTTIQTTSTFTHSYARSGTYNPAFTISDDNGHAATVSGSVTITPLY